MIDKEIGAIAALLTSNDIHQSALAELLLEKGIISEEEFQARVDKLVAEQFQKGAKTYAKILRYIARRDKPPEADEEN